MAVKIEDVLQTNLVLVGISLLNTPAEVSAFRQQVGTEVVSTEAGIGNEVINSTHTLSRDRITVASIADRTSVLREYPREEDLGRFAEVALAAIGHSVLNGQQLRAFGFNIELVYETAPPERAIRYLAQRLFKPNLLQDGEGDLVGGSGKIFYERYNRQWQATLEPRLNDGATTRIFAGLNLHRPESDISLLTESEVLSALQLVWHEAHGLVKRIDRGDIE